MATTKHSKDFEKYNTYYRMNFMTREQLQRWVVINAKHPNKGITGEEYKEITGEEYEV